MSPPACGRPHEPSSRCSECDDLQQIGAGLNTIPAQQLRLQHDRVLREGAPEPGMGQSQVHPEDVVRAAPPWIPAGAVYLPTRRLSARQAEVITRMMEGNPRQDQAVRQYPQYLDFTDQALDQGAPPRWPIDVLRPETNRVQGPDGIARQQQPPPRMAPRGVDQGVRADQAPRSAANRSRITRNATSSPSQGTPHRPGRAANQQRPSTFVPAQRRQRPPHTFPPVAHSGALGRRPSQVTTSGLGETSSSGEESSD